MVEITDKYDTLFRPAGYAFAIWGLIYLAFIAYAVYQLLPAQRGNRLFDKIAVVFIVSNILGMTWQIVFRNDMITASLALIIAMLISSIIMYAFARQASIAHQVSYWVSVPFGIYMAWLSVATIANIAIWLADIDWRGGGVSETLWTNIMLVVALGLSIVLSLKFCDVSIPLVVTWAILAIYVHSKDSGSGIATVALIAGLAGLGWSICLALWPRSHTRSTTAKPA
jgi:tryptophan-rich sensory protein